MNHMVYRKENQDNYSLPSNWFLKRELITVTKSVLVFYIFHKAVTYRVVMLEVVIYSHSYFLQYVWSIQHCDAVLFTELPDHVHLKELNTQTSSYLTQNLKPPID